MLNFQTFGEKSSNPDLLIAHGLFGSARNWRAIARHLSSDRQIHVVDMRNHGDSFWDDDNSYAALADDLAKVIESIGSPVDVLGHSMGGKAAMMLALSRPELVNRLLVADIAPKAYSHDQVSNVDIMKSLSMNSFSRRSEADAILSEKLPDNAVRAFFLQSLVVSEQGNSWQLNLNALGANMDLIVGFPEATGKFNGETLFLRGGLSQYVSDNDLPRIKELFPSSRLETIDGAGHWLHADATRAFLNSVKEFLS
jgi:pimeloyl-ACP methyl ester carboxylesterase